MNLVQSWDSKPFDLRFTSRFDWVYDPDFGWVKCTWLTESSKLPEGWKEISLPKTLEG